MHILLIFLMFLDPAKAAPAACSEVDLSSTGEVTANFPRWSQGNTHLCYAFSAATLIDRYRFSHGDQETTHATSPLLLALKTIENFKDLGSSFKGGKVEHAFSTVRQFGSCSAKIISDKLGPYKIDFLLKTLQSFHDQLGSLKENRSRLAEKIFRFLKSSGAKEEDIPAPMDIEKNLILTSDEFVTRTLLSFCGENKKLDYLPALKILFQPQASTDQILDRVQSLLSSQVPLGINFCSNVVTDPTYKGEWRGDQWYCKDALNHSAVVLGRKLVDGKCQFLVQDSGCNGYSKTPAACQDEQYWLDTDQLLKNTHGIFWLD